MARSGASPAGGAGVPIGATHCADAGGDSSTTKRTARSRVVIIAVALAFRTLLRGHDQAFGSWPVAVVVGPAPQGSRSRSRRRPRPKALLSVSYRRHLSKKDASPIGGRTPAIAALYGRARRAVCRPATARTARRSQYLRVFSRRIAGAAWRGDPAAVIEPISTPRFGVFSHRTAAVM